MMLVALFSLLSQYNLIRMYIKLQSMKLFITVQVQYNSYKTEVGPIYIKVSGGIYNRLTGRSIGDSTLTSCLKCSFLHINSFIIEYIKINNGIGKQDYYMTYHIWPHFSTRTPTLRVMKFTILVGLSWVIITIYYTVIQNS